ncbi:alpha/beta hydrolase [Aeromicrobium terrae]|uniref:Alpha/beta hydrolase n=1 Tax=Aeromicrobium terrae TaxID=2498846 RepID=A0A5C8NLA3_9ACTN|nr:alpha/beta hydrolase [Aeromicrobium terrae]TXL61906.1 alpha/beta hydrolase [Aeromicrobium terrae]
MPLTPDAVEYLRLLETEEVAHQGWTIDQRRDAGRAEALSVEDRIGLDDVHDVDADGVPCRVYRPRVGAPVALYVHGGGWVFHDLETHDEFCRYLAHRTGWALLAVDYRLAPENPYPAPLDDVATAARWLRAEARSLRLSDEVVAGIGDSSGANLLAGLTVRDASLLDALVLIYPPVDASAPYADEDNAALEAKEMDAYWRHYAPGALADEPEVSPLRADVSGFPPTFLVTAEHDVLRDQGEAFAASLAAAGVDVTASRTLGMIHGYWRHPDLLPPAAATVVSVGAFLEEQRAGVR